TNNNENNNNINTDTNNIDEPLLKTYNGGVQTQVIEGPGIYYMGIIDILQKWDFKKKFERFIKVYLCGNDKYGISAVDPIIYQKRFMIHMKKIMITDEEFYMWNNIELLSFQSQTLFVY